MSLPREATVVIIGGGIVGASVAYHLAEKECDDTVLLEQKEEPGEGTTGQSAAGVRLQFSTPVNIQMAKYNMEFYEELDRQTGGFTFYHYGYLYPATTEARRQWLDETLQVQRQYLSEVERLSPAEIKERWPHMNVEDILCANYCGRDGLFEPNSAVQALIQRAREKGVKLFTNTRVTGIRVEKGQIQGVEVNNAEFIKADYIVNASGPWCNKVGAMVGIRYPVGTVRRRGVYLEPVDEIDYKIPLTSDHNVNFWLRSEPNGGFLLCDYSTHDIQDPDHISKDITSDYLEMVAKKTSHRVPVLRDAGVIEGVAGILTYTHDGHAIIGEDPWIKGFIHAVGFSGHGFQQAPSAGRAISEIIVDGSYQSIDMSHLNLDRFKKDSKGIEEETLSCHEGTQYAEAAHPMW